MLSQWIVCVLQHRLEVLLLVWHGVTYAIREHCQLTSCKINHQLLGAGGVALMVHNRITSCQGLEESRDGRKRNHSLENWVADEFQNDLFDRHSFLSSARRRSRAMHVFSRETLV